VQEHRVKVTKGGKDKLRLEQTVVVVVLAQQELVSVQEVTVVLAQIGNH
jgi:hypothetical protein